MTTGYPGTERAFLFHDADPRRLSDLPAADAALGQADLLPVKNGSNLARATVAQLHDSASSLANAAALAAVNTIAVNQGGTAKKAALSLFCGFELAATFATISATSTVPRIVLVTADEGFAGATTGYFKNGTAAAIKLS